MAYSSSSEALNCTTMTVRVPQDLPEWRLRAGATRRARSEDKILGAALQLFEQVGFDQASVESVAFHAGVGPATIYQRYGTKGALAAAVLAKKAAFLNKAALKDASTLPVSLAVQRHLRRAAKVITDNRVLARAVFVVFSKTEGPPVDSRDPRLIFPLPAPLAGILQVGVDNGEIECPTTAIDTAASVTSMLMVRIITRNESPQASADFVYNTVMKGLMVR